MGVTAGGTVGDGMTSVGIVGSFAVGSVSVNVGDGAIVCAGGWVGLRLAVGDNVSVAGLHAAINSTRQSKALKYFFARKREGKSVSLLSILKGSFVWARIFKLLK